MLVLRVVPLDGRPRRVVRDEAVRAALLEVGVTLPPDPLALARRCAACGATTHGRPEVVAALAAGRHVSCAYAGSSAVAVAACDDGPVGVDLESRSAVARADVRPVLLSARERRARRTWSDDDVARTWVRKEALLKATGHGLAVAPSDVTLGPPDEPARLVAWPPGRGPAPRVRWVEPAARSSLLRGTDLVLVAAILGPL